MASSDSRVSSIWGSAAPMNATGPPRGATRVWPFVGFMIIVSFILSNSYRLVPLAWGSGLDVGFCGGCSGEFFFDPFEHSVEALDHRIGGIVRMRPRNPNIAEHLN